LIYELDDIVKKLEKEKGSFTEGNSLGLYDALEKIIFFY